MSLLDQLFPDRKALERIQASLDRVLLNQRTQERRMSEAQEILDRVAREVAESKAETQETLTAVQKVLAYMVRIPDIVRKAVEDALAANPGADLSSLTQVAEELDAQQADLNNAQAAIDAALVSAPPPPETEPGA